MVAPPRGLVACAAAAAAAVLTAPQGASAFQGSAPVLRVPRRARAATGHHGGATTIGRWPDRGAATTIGRGAACTACTAPSMGLASGLRAGARGVGATAAAFGVLDPAKSALGKGVELAKSLPKLLVYKLQLWLTQGALTKVCVARG